MNAFSLPVYWVLELWTYSCYCEVQSLPKDHSNLSERSPGTQERVRPAFPLLTPSQSVAFVCLGYLFGFAFYQDKWFVFFQKPDDFSGIWIPVLSEHRYEGCRGFTAALGCTDTWKYFSRFRNSQFSFLHVTWNCVLANNSVLGTRTREKGILCFSQEKYEEQRNDCLISLSLPF